MITPETMAAPIAHQILEELRTKRAMQKDVTYVIHHLEHMLRQNRNVVPHYLPHVPITLELSDDIHVSLIMVRGWLLTNLTWVWSFGPNRVYGLYKYRRLNHPLAIHSLGDDLLVELHKSLDTIVQKVYTFCGIDVCDQNQTILTSM